jgi:anion-transporting  ArsA/GET3 family ATPase
MMLDPKRTFDELIEHLAPTAERAQEIKANRVYQELSSAVSGSQEFTAIAKLYELDQEHQFDLLILDTPPSRNALEFLDAPRRLNAFLEGPTVKALVRPTGIGMRVLGRGAMPVLGALSRVTGVDLLSDLGTFFGLLAGMTGDFSLRAKKVEKLLAAPTTAFVLVTSAEREPIDEAIWFYRRVSQAKLPFGGVVVNRVHHDLLSGHDSAEVKQALARTLPRELAAKVAQNFSDYHVLARRDERNISRLQAAIDSHPLLLVPHLDDDIHDFEGLLQMRQYLFASGPEREQLIANMVA